MKQRHRSLRSYHAIVFHWVGLIVACLGVLSAQSFAAENPPRLKRADSFLGIHFDFHANAGDKEIGKNTTPAMVERIIDLVHPDYIQIDCKGHPGFSSYPTKVGNPAGGFVGDPLRVWREVTARRGVALFMHYSGVLDAEAVRQHPDWAAIESNGKPHARATSVFGPYVDKLLIPQLKELAGVYGVDGVWVDGECWGAVPDYSERALKLFRERTGITDVPRRPADPHWSKFIDFQREGFREYLRYYLAEMKQAYPGFQIASNWAFSDHMPEPVSAPVHFLSGDFAPNDSVNSARISGRCLARQGVPWDLMSWSFTRPADRKKSVQKTAVQLQQEAAMVLALGGGYQAYFKQQRDGSIFDEQMAVMAEVAEFCRARQAICHRAEAVPQVALLYSTAAHYRSSPRVFHPSGALFTALKGVLQALLDGQSAVEVLSEHHLKGHMKDYPLIVVPEVDYLDPDFRAELLAYAKGGGKLLLIGPRTAGLFQQELDDSLKGYLIKPADTGDGKTPPPLTSLTIPYGKGQIAAMSSTFGQDYQKAANADTRQRLASLVHELFPAPLVRVQGSQKVDVVLGRKEGRLLVNLINTSGPHADPQLPVIHAIPPVNPLQVAIRTEKKPARLTLEPGGQPLKWDYRDGAVHLTLPKLEIHSIIVVE